MSEEKPKNKNWARGVDMPEFSGSSWKELEDIWPADVRVASEAWKIISVFTPALLASQIFQKELMNGKYIVSRDFFILCLIQRCEEARTNVATEAWPALKAMNIGGKLWYSRKAELTKLGLIENIPAAGLRLYRVTGLGKAVIRNFVENVEKAHQDIKYWVSLQPAENAERVNRYLQANCFGEPQKVERIKKPR